MNKPREEIQADGSRWIGDGPTYIVFTPRGDVGLLTQGERAERRALKKNFTSEISVGDITVTIEELACHHKGVPIYSENFARLAESLVHSVNEEQEARRLSNRLAHVLFGAWRLAHEELGKNSHARFRIIVIYLAKRLKRAPTRAEIRQEKFPDAPREAAKDNAREVTRLCDANGLSWLPQGKPGPK